MPLLSTGQCANLPPVRDQLGHMQPRIHLLLGPVGAGKSTYARKLCRQLGAMSLNLDDWMATLFLQDRPSSNVMDWYKDRAARCLEQIWKTAENMLVCGHEVVLEVGLIRRTQREAFYARIGPWAGHLVLYVLDAPCEVRQARVQQRNTYKGETYSMDVPPHIFELASALWEPPCDQECAEHLVLWEPMSALDGRAVTDTANR